MATDSADLEKKLRALRKKLAQIEKLKEKSSSELDAAAREKVASEATLKAEEKELEEQLAAAGGPAAPASTAPAPAAKAAAEPKKKSAPKVVEAPAVEDPSPQSGLSPMESEKRIKAIKKKLQQIQKLKEKASLDAEAQEKVASEAELLKEMAALEAGEEYVPPAKPEKGMPQAVDDLTDASPTTAREDPHAMARAQALEAPPADLGLLIDAETEKRFKALQKKLRDIAKLHEKDKLDKLQEDKLKQEPGLIEELAAIQERAAKLVEERRARMASVVAPKADKFTPQPRASLPDWQCNECGASGRVSDLIGSDGALACNKCGGTFITYNTFKGGDDEDDEDDDGQDAGAAKAKKSYDSKDLKTKRQKQPPPAMKKLDDGVMPTPESATWPEIKEVLESGDRGVDKSRLKKGIEVNKAKAGAPYDKFDQTLLKCSFLTRVELKLPLATLESEAFQLYFPGALKDDLLELILKENQLNMVPPGVQQLQRIRSIDLSHNKIEALPDTDTWECIASTLELLDLSFNKLTSIAPLAPLKKLSQLKVDANQLTSVEGVSWGELKQLTMFSAVGNELASLPEAVGDCAGSLEHLELSENKLTSVPTALCDLKKLKFLNIAGNPIKDQKVVKAADKSIKDLKAYLSKVGGSKGKK